MGKPNQRAAVGEGQRALHTPPQDVPLGEFDPVPSAPAAPPPPAAATAAAAAGVCMFAIDALRSLRGLPEPDRGVRAPPPPTSAPPNPAGAQLAWLEVRRETGDGKCCCCCCRRCCRCTLWASWASSRVTWDSVKYNKTQEISAYRTVPKDCGLAPE